MQEKTTPIEGVKVVHSPRRSDSRGYFFRAFCDESLAPTLKGRVVRQINVSSTISVGTVRGLHYQHPPHAEMKLIRCLKGKVWDVAVDLRRGSPTFLSWFAQELSAENDLMMVIPEGCAHGFQALEADSQLLYLHTAPYAPGSEGGVHFADPALSIPWPLTVAEVSSRDASFSKITTKDTGINL